MDYDTFITFAREFSTLFIELASAIIGSFYYYKYKNTILKYFLIYLWSIVLIEYSAYILGEYYNVSNNKWLFNSFYILSFSYLFFTYWSIINNKKRKLFTKYLAATYILVSFINVFFEDFITRSQTIPFIVGSSFLILAIIFYFIEILKSKKVLAIKKNLLFWISVGLLLFYVGYIPFSITINYYADMQKFTSLFLILYTLIIVSNTCFIIGFIWSSKKQLY